MQNLEIVRYVGQPWYGKVSDSISNSIYIPVVGAVLIVYIIFTETEVRVLLYRERPTFDSLTLPKRYITAPSFSLFGRIFSCLARISERLPLRSSHITK